MTALARIRGAAVRLFAERGFDATSIRDVAAEARVSSSLVVHHFKTKAQLKEATDAWLISALTSLLAELLAGGGADLTKTAGSLAEILRDEPDLMSYLRRMLVDGGEAASGLFQGLVEATATVLAAQEAAGIVRPSVDPRGRAVFLIVNDLGAIILRDLVEQAIGVDPLGAAGLRQWGEVVMEVYTGGIYARGATPPDAAPRAPQGTAPAQPHVTDPDATGPETD